MAPASNPLGALRGDVVRHFILCGLTLFALVAQFSYRVPNRFVDLVLAAIGPLLLGLVALVSMNRILAQPPGNETLLTPAERLSMVGSLALLVLGLLVPSWLGLGMIRLGIAFALVTIVVAVFVVAVRLAAPVLGPGVRRLLRGAEQAVAWLVGAFILASVVVFVNGYRDTAPAEEVSSEIVTTGEGRTELLGVTFFSWADVRSWRRPGTLERFLLHPGERDLTWVGVPIVIRMRAGALGIPWVERVERDREKYYRQVLAIAPAAAGPRRERLLWLVERQRWADTLEAAREYVALYPDDYDFMKAIAASLGVVGRAADMVSLVEPFVSRQPENYELLNLVGWGLHQSGQSVRGIALLERAAALEPENWMAYYHLGYAYRATGRSAQAVKAFERVLELRRNYPEIEGQLDQLRRSAAR